MEARVVKLNFGLPYCEAKTSNDILVVFQPRDDGSVSLNDVLDFDLEILDHQQSVTNLSTGKTFSIKIKSNDVHDLRLPMKHGGSRLPSLARRNGKE